jgi:hypothetical protein
MMGPPMVGRVAESGTGQQLSVEPNLYPARDVGPSGPGID